MNDNEKLLVEAINNMFKNNDVFGRDPEENETSHYYQFQWETMEDSFKLKIINSSFFESISSAFRKIHSYKYLDDPTFMEAFRSELKSRAVPGNEMVDAYKAVIDVIKESGGKITDDVIKFIDNPIPTYGRENQEALNVPKNWRERDAGWNPALDEITDMTRNADNRKLDRPDPFTGGGPRPKKNELKDFNL